MTRAATSEHCPEDLGNPSHTVPRIPAAEARALAEHGGATAEITAFQLRHQPGYSAVRLAEYVRAVGLRNVVLSSDAGQPDTPEPPVALARLIDELAAQGLDRSALVAAASEIPERLVLP